MTGWLNIHVPPPGICHRCFLVHDDFLNNYTKVYSVFIVFSTYVNTIIALWLFLDIAFIFFRVLSYSLILPIQYHHLCKTNLVCLWNLHIAYSKWCLYCGSCCRIGYDFPFLSFFCFLQGGWCSVAQLLFYSSTYLTEQNNNLATTTRVLLTHIKSVTHMQYYL
jgi:hypothetical protein